MLFTNSEINAPEYYFDSNKTTYTHGYNNFNDAYNNVIVPLQNDYKISKK